MPTKPSSKAKGVDRSGEWGGHFLLLNRLMGLGEHHEVPQRSLRWNPGWKWISVLSKCHRMPLVEMFVVKWRPVSREKRMTSKNNAANNAITACIGEWLPTSLDLPDFSLCQNGISAWLTTCHQYSRSYENAKHIKEWLPRLIIRWAAFQMLS